MFANRFSTITATLLVSITGSVNAGDEDAPEQSVPIELFLLPANTTVERYVVLVEGADITSGATEQLIYSNTLGTFGAALGAGKLIADDITTTVPGGCNLLRYEFPVVGKVNPAGTGGSYTVDFAMYRSCPQSVPSGSRPGLIIPGTQFQRTFTDQCQNSTDNDGDTVVNDGCPAVGPEETGAQCENAIDDDGDTKVNDGCPAVSDPETDVDSTPRLISFVAAPNVMLETNMWFGVKFSRNNAGVMVGAPALVGFSADNIDYPGFPCDSDFGGFPEYPHASFNLEIYADAECPEAFVGYTANKPSGSVYNPGADVFLADDIQLGSAGCSMVAYEVAVRGLGFYNFRLQNNCESGIIAGTERTWSQPQHPDVKIVRFTFDPPIALPRDLWFEAKVNNSTGSVIISGQQACIGETGDLVYAVVNNVCTQVNPYDLGEGIHGAVNLAITCTGAPPAGACCDMTIMQCVGGLDDGRLCCPANDERRPYCYGNPALDRYPPCTLPGTCESVCRETPLMNCPWPPRFTPLQPAWVEGATCESDPFPYPCGAAACCRPDQVCENLTQNECNAVEPVDAPRLWQQGLYCGVGVQACPFVPCLNREGDCLVVHQEPGCANPFCCTDVCTADSYCCTVEWDRVCVESANELCSNMGEHDECLVGGQSALLVEADSATVFSNVGATQNELDPGFCCRNDASDVLGLGTVWFKFVATDTSARVSTCGSDPARDSLIDVFAVGDPTTEETACASLIPIACSDDVEECGGGSRHGRICVKGLEPGQTYYVMVASKTAEQQGVYQLEIRSPCFEEPIWIPIDCNKNKLPDGCELGRGTATDCNVNHVLDECDIASGRSFDCDGNAIPDDCDGLIETLTPMPTLPGGAFGTSVVMDGTWLVVGSGFEFQEPRANYPLYIYRRTPAGWNLAQTIPLPVAPTYVGMDDGWIAVTGDLDDAAYLFRLVGDQWVDMGTLQGPAIDPCARSGYPLVIDGDRIALSKGFCQQQQSGTEELVFVFRRDGLNWVKEAQLTAPSGSGKDNFGASVALAGDRLIVGTPAFYSESQASAHVFRRENDSWAYETTLYPPDEKSPARSFGRSTAFDGRTAIIGATLAFSELLGETGAAYVFALDGMAWSYEAKLLASDASNYDRFGLSVGITDNTAVIGAIYAGAAYTFHRQGTQWIELAKLSQLPATYEAYFGYGVATDGTLVAVGAPEFASVYVFQPPKADCNENDIPDLCDVRDGTSADCNHDDVPDLCTLTDGTTPDCNQSGIPDDCESQLPFDYDLDGGVDLIDLAGFQRCFTSEGQVTVAPCCTVFDSEPDGDVDLIDFVAFGGAFLGP